MKLRYYQKELAYIGCKRVIEDRSIKIVLGAPTGSGKTPTLATIIWYLHVKTGLRILVLSHVKEILEQNIGTVKTMVTEEVGVYSAGLEQKVIKDITVAGVQSAYNQTQLFVDFDIVIIDECHTVGPDESGMYRKLLGAIMAPVIGLTATPYRLDCGYIYGDHDGAFFDEMACDYTSPEKYLEIQDAGYLTPITYRWSEHEMDTSDIETNSKGEFIESQLADKFDRELVTTQIVHEMMEHGKDRKKWIVFAIDVQHCEHIAEILNLNGITAVAAHSKMDDSNVIPDFKEGKFRALVNVYKYTTGVDVPDIDYMADCAPTRSAQRHVQKTGRLTRLFEGKKDGLVSDFAGNVIRNGPIHDPIIKKPTKKQEESAPPCMKKCKVCGTMSMSACRTCSNCGHEFQFKHGLSNKALQAMINAKPVWLEVDGTDYNFIQPEQSYIPPYLEVTHWCNDLPIKRTLNFAHVGDDLQEAREFINKRIPKSLNKEGMAIQDIIQLLKPTEKIKVECINNTNIVIEDKLFDN